MIKNKVFTKYYLFSLLGVLLACGYPIYMGISVVTDMIRYGTVYAENYPKYVIPYTPIALALIIGVALIPPAMRFCKKFALLAGTAISTVVFFASEWILESMVIVTRTVTQTVVVNVSKLEAWQMYMCATFLPPAAVQEQTLTEVDVLMCEYSPAFKLHFYIISVVLIIAILNCFYGFAHMIQTGDKSRLRSLVIQSVTAGAFLGMCIWACFTAFYRNGDIHVSALSAVLMCVFFLLFGITVGIYAASFLLKRRKLFSIVLPAVIASLVTLVMYIGEMILLNGHLYRFGNGFLFDSIPGIVLAPVDVAIVLLSGGLAALIAHFVRVKTS